MPSPEFRELLYALREAQHFERIGDAAPQVRRDTAMANAEAALMTWLASRHGEIEALRWVRQGDHA